MTLEEIAAAGIDPARVTQLPDGGWTYQSGPLTVTWGPRDEGRWEYESTLTLADGPDGVMQYTDEGWAPGDAEMLRTVATAGQYHEIARRLEAGEFRTTTEGEQG